jgi:hypothetical protein
MSSVTVSKTFSRLRGHETKKGSCSRPNRSQTRALSTVKDGPNLVRIGLSV